MSLFLEEISWEDYLQQFKPVAGKTLICLGKTKAEDQIFTFGEIEPQGNICIKEENGEVSVKVRDGRFGLKNVHHTQIHIAEESEINTLRQNLRPWQRELITTGKYEQYRGGLNFALRFQSSYAA